MTQTATHHQNQPDTNKKLIRKAQVIEIVGVGKTKLNELVKAKKFPQPIRLSQNLILWELAEIEQWIEEQKAQRTA